MTLVTQAEAVFVSSLQPSDAPSRTQVAQAIRNSQRAHGGFSGCTVAVATEYGEHPDVAVDRMRWALSLVATDARGWPS